MAATIKILIIEDEAATSYLCETMLRKAGYETEACATGTAGLAALQRAQFDLVLLDLNLPDIDGLELAGRLRRLRPSLPILMMTVRVQPEERVAGFEAGALDYLVKPFHPEELRYRVCNALARSRPEEKNCRRHFFDGWILDLDNRSLEAESGRQVELTRGEFDLLAALVSAKGRVLSRDFLLDVVVRAGGEGHHRTVDVLVSRLRKKIEENSAAPKYILTVTGIGYRLGPLS